MPPPTPSDSVALRRGFLAAFCCYLTWGLVPLYWRQMASIDARELIAHRLVWSLVFLLAVLAATRRLGEVRAALTDARALGLNALSGSLLTVNWLIYVWSVNTGHVLECSLGYFLVPLLNILLGRLVLHESMSRLQWAAIGFATLGVSLMVLRLGHFPWVALGLCTSFGFYGLLRKRSPLAPLTGLTIETLVLLPIAGGWLVGGVLNGSGALGRVSPALTLLVLSTGVVTSIPLVLFAYGAKRLRLTTLGLLQYVSPTCQFLLGWLFYRESFDRTRAASFVVIWVGLALYTLDALLTQRRRRLPDSVALRST